MQSRIGKETILIASRKRLGYITGIMHSSPLRYREPLTSLKLNRNHYPCSADILLVLKAVCNNMIPGTPQCIGRSQKCK